MPGRIQELSPAVVTEARRLAKRPPRALPRIGLDVALWVGLAAVGSASPWPVTLACVVAIGLFPMHDLLIHGHEAVHRLVSRHRPLNEALLFLLHAFAGASGTAHRAFHLDHHRWTHEDRDPEGVVVEGLGGSGLAYLVLPAVAPVPVNLGPFLHRRHHRHRPRVVAELAGAVLLHAAGILVLGPLGWATWMVAPLLLGMGPAFIVRSLCEHHARPSGDPWHDAGAVQTWAPMSLLWSNIEHHLEHHLFPKVPTRHLPALRRALRPEYAARGVRLETGWLRTAWRALRQPVHRPATADPPAGR